MTYLIAKKNLLDYHYTHPIMMFSLATPYKVEDIYEGAWVVRDDNGVKHYIGMGSRYEQENFNVFNFPD